MKLGFTLKTVLKTAFIARTGLKAGVCMQCMRTPQGWRKVCTNETNSHIEILACSP